MDIHPQNRYTGNMMSNLIWLPMSMAIIMMMIIREARESRWACAAVRRRR